MTSNSRADDVPNLGEWARLTPLAKKLATSCDWNLPNDVRRQLENSGEDRQAILNWNHGSDFTVLYKAVKRNRPEVVRVLLEFGADVNDIPKGGSPALIEAARLGYMQVAQLLIAFGAALDVADPTGKNAIVLAVGKKHTDVALFLINAGVPCGVASRSSSSGWTAAHYAADADDVAVFMAIYEKEKEAMDGYRYSPLALAARRGALNVVAACLAHPILRQPAEAVDISGLLKQCKKDVVRQLVLSHRTARAVEQGIDATPDTVLAQPSSSLSI